MSSQGDSRMQFCLSAIVFRRIKGCDTGKETESATMAVSETKRKN